MKLEVEIAEKADRDLRNIYFYIAVDLSAPENAERQINRLWDAILSLDELPETPRRTRRKTVCRGVSGSLFAMIQIRA